MKIHLEKKAIRALGIAECFRKSVSEKSVLAGVVIRSDLIMDGCIYGHATLEGDDATENILSMYKSLNRNDINVIMIAGSVIALYNIIDSDELHKETKVPVLNITFEESEGLGSHIKNRFPKGWKSKLKAYKKIGDRKNINLHTGYRVFVRAVGMSQKEAKRTLDKYTIQGSIPEPVRIAKLLARARFAT
ncbi:MAG: DUF99 family protein [Thaumarchaeota archaeon]|nr:DUF99 family protein [Nitrososphaerota archaeon]